MGTCPHAFRSGHSRLQQLMGWTPPPRRHQRARLYKRPRRPQWGRSPMNTTQVAVDLAKSVFQIAVSRSPGRVDEQHRLSRTRCYRFFAERSPVEVLMEACGTAHHWGRELESLGHRVSLLPPADVRRYRDRDKTDRADTKALLEAARNEVAVAAESTRESPRPAPSQSLLPLWISPATCLQRQQSTSRFFPGGFNSAHPKAASPTWRSLATARAYTASTAYRSTSATRDGSIAGAAARGR